MLIRKVIFVRTILLMDDNEVVKKVFKLRVQRFCEDPNRAILNKSRSPIFEMLHAALRLNMINLVIEYSGGLRVWSKANWSKIAWENGWKICDQRNNVMVRYHKDMDLFRVIGIRIRIRIRTLLLSNRILRYIEEIQ